MTDPALRVAMLVTDANERSSFTRCDPTRASPVLHPAEEALLQGLSGLEGIEIEVIYAKSDPLASDFRKEGNCSYVPVPYQSVGLPGLRSFYLGRLRALLKHLRSSQYDLVHAQGTERECGLAASLARGPSLITLHGNLSQIAKTLQARRGSYFWTAALLQSFAVKRVSGVHCISAHAEKSLEEITKATWVIPNPVAPAWYLLPRRASSAPFVTCVADITEWKNPILLAQASEDLHEAIPETEVHFYGACDERHPYGMAFLQEIRSRPWCFFHGKSPDALLRKALSQATCAVLPSKQENFGLALAEAMAAGVPCIGSDAGGIPDVVRHGRTGLLFPEGDGQALARCLVEIHRNPEMAEALALAGRREARERFTVEVVAAAHLAMYRELLNSSNHD